MIIDKILKKISTNMTGDIRISPALHTLFFRGNKVYATDKFKGIKVEYKYQDFGEVNYDASDIKNNNLDLSKLDKKQCSFPELDKFLDIKTQAIVGLDVEFLIKTLEIYKVAKVKYIKLEIGDKFEPIKITTNGKGNGNEISEITSLIMPIKL